MREEMTLGARCEPDVGKGLGKELLAGERGVVEGVRLCAIVTLNFFSSEHGRRVPPQDLRCHSDLRWTDTENSWPPVSIKEKKFGDNQGFLEING